MRDFKSFFSDIYKNNIWGGSGGGSSIENTELYRKYLERFLVDNKIKTVIDFGCGDWQSSRIINWHGIDYVGIDYVDEIVSANILKYMADNITFDYIDKIEEFFDKKADLLILKDVLQHWNNVEIDYFLGNVKNNFKYVLITNSSNQLSGGQDNPLYEGALSARFNPLKKYECQIVLEYWGGAPKEISLIKRDE